MNGPSTASDHFLRPSYQPPHLSYQQILEVETFYFFKITDESNRLCTSPCRAQIKMLQFNARSL